MRIDELQHDSTLRVRPVVVQFNCGCEEFWATGVLLREDDSTPQTRYRSRNRVAYGEDTKAPFRCQGGVDFGKVVPRHVGRKVLEKCITLRASDFTLEQQVRGERAAAGWTFFVIVTTPLADDHFQLVTLGVCERAVDLLLDQLSELAHGNG